MSATKAENQAQSLANVKAFWGECMLATSKATQHNARMWAQPTCRSAALQAEGSLEVPGCTCKAGVGQGRAPCLLSHENDVFSYQETGTYPFARLYPEVIPGMLKLNGTTPDLSKSRQLPGRRGTSSLMDVGAKGPSRYPYDTDALQSRLSTVALTQNPRLQHNMSAEQAFT